VQKAEPQLAKTDAGVAAQQATMSTPDIFDFIFHLSFFSFGIFQEAGNSDLFSNVARHPEKVHEATRAVLE